MDILPNLHDTLTTEISTTDTRGLDTYLNYLEWSKICHVRAYDMYPLEEIKLWLMLQSLAEKNLRRIWIFFFFLKDFDLPGLRSWILSKLVDP